MATSSLGGKRYFTEIGFRECLRQGPSIGHEKVGFKSYVHHKSSITVKLLDLL